MTFRVSSFVHVYVHIYEPVATDELDFLSSFQFRRKDRRLTTLLHDFLLDYPTRFSWALLQL